jgi:hypothetical protein
MSTITLATKQGLRVIGGAHSDDALDGAAITARALARGGESDLWAIVGGHDLVRVRGGHATPVATIDAVGTCVLAERDHVWIGTEEAHLYRFAGDDARKVEAFDAAPSRKAWHTPWGGPPDTRSLAARDDRVYVNVHVGGILISDDGGITWEPTLDLDVDVHEVNVDEANTVWAATGERGLGESRDGGRSWTFHDRGLHGTYLRCAVPVADGVVVTASSGPHHHDGAVYRFDREGFSPCDGDLPARFAGNLDTGSLAAHGNTVALAAIDGRCYVSEDAGVTWTVAATDLPPVAAVLVS